MDGRVTRATMTGSDNLQDSAMVSTRCLDKDMLDFGASGRFQEDLYDV